MIRNPIAIVLLSCGLTIACGNTQDQPPQALEPDAASTAAENAGVSEIGPAVDPERSAPPPRESSSTAAPGRPTTASPVEAAPTPPAPSVPARREVTVPAGTALPLELLTPLSSETARLETAVRARLRQAVLVDGATAVPAGSVLHGTVTDVAQAGRVRGRSRLAFQFVTVELPGGARDDLQTNPIVFEGEASRGEDATKIGAGAVGGAIVGGILGGGSGAAKGAAIGGAAGTGVVLATRGAEVALSAGTAIAATLATPFVAQVPAP